MAIPLHVFTASLAAFYQGIKVCHIEAGLRTNNIYRPFPGEMNRQLVSKIAYLHFSPTIENKKNLINENIDPIRIFVTGNTVIDSILWTTKNDKNFFQRGISKFLIGNIIPIRKLCTSRQHIRRENIGRGIDNICNSIIDLIKKYDDLFFYIPLFI